MEEIIRDLLSYAEKHNNTDERENIVEFASRILHVLSQTKNSPQEWQSLGEKLANEWNNGTFDSDHREMFFEKLELYNFGEDECFGIATFDDEQ
jgi:Fe-S cluster biosynthesis and repair protein YggX